MQYRDYGIQLFCIVLRSIIRGNTGVCTQIVQHTHTHTHSMNSKALKPILVRVSLQSLMSRQSTENLLVQRQIMNLYMCVDVLDYKCVCSIKLCKKRWIIKARVMNVWNTCLTPRELCVSVRVTLLKDSVTFSTGQ